MTASGISDLRGRRILFLNWRDRGHPDAGGAENHCQTIAEGFACAGAHVTLFTASYDGSAKQEVMNGVTIIRRGGRLTLYPRAALHLIRHRSDYACVVDVQNGISFFAPFFVRASTAVVGVIHHVHQQQFAMYMPRFQSFIGRFLEGPVSRWVYRKTPVIVVSPSTRQAVRKQLRFRSPLYLIPNGQSPQCSPVVRSEYPTIVYTGRLVPHKRIDLLLEAVAALRPKWNDLAVHICGTGSVRSDLEERASNLGLRDLVTFHGYVSDERRNELVASSWLSVNPSVGEGWGLTVLESNSLGVPTVAFDVPGLRDAIVDGVTGWLLTGPPETLGEELHRVMSLLDEPAAVLRFRTACRTWADRFSWDRCVQSTARVVADEIDRVSNGHKRRSTPSDISVIAEIRSYDPELIARLGDRRLRRTDEWSVDEGVIRLLMRGCDERDALSGLERVGVGGLVDMRIATAADLLLGLEGSPE